MKYQYWLTNIEGIGPVKTDRILMNGCGARDVYEMSQAQLEQIPGITGKDAAKIKQSQKNWKLTEAWEAFARRKIQFVTREMPEYPERLRNIYRPPYALYIRGRMPKEETLSVAIVGARHCSEYGKYMAKKLGEELANQGIAVVSGLADGVDSCGHAGALASENGETYAVLGCGIDICYPQKNCNLYQQIWKRGGIISEYPPGLAPVAGLFPERNRIISGLADVVVVVEAREKSGSLITADFALEQGKEVYALPGRVTDPLSMGCLRLMKQGAGVLLSPEDLLDELGFFSKKSNKFDENRKLLLEKEERLVYSYLDLQPKNIDQLMKETGCDMTTIVGILMRLQQKGFVKESFKNHYICM